MALAMNLAGILHGSPRASMGSDARFMGHEFRVAHPRHEHRGIAPPDQTRSKCTPVMALPENTSTRRKKEVVETRGKKQGTIESATSDEIDVQWHSLGKLKNKILSAGSEKEARNMEHIKNRRKYSKAQRICHQRRNQCAIVTPGEIKTQMFGETFGKCKKAYVEEGGRGSPKMTKVTHGVAPMGSSRWEMLLAY